MHKIHPKEAAINAIVEEIEAYRQTAEARMAKVIADRKRAVEAIDIEGIRSSKQIEALRAPAYAALYAAIDAEMEYDAKEEARLSNKLAAARMRHYSEYE